MWKALIDWTLALFGMVRELEAHGSEIRDLQRRMRDPKPSPAAPAPPAASTHVRLKMAKLSLILPRPT